MKSSQRSKRAQRLGLFAAGLAAIGATFMVLALSGTTTAFAGDPPVLPAPEVTPTEAPPPTTPPEPTTPAQPTLAPTERPEIPQIIVTVAPTATRVPPTNTPVPPTATPQQQVVAGVSALPRTGAGDSSAGTNWQFLVLGSLLFTASAAAAAAAWKASKAG